jgi:hypothetical protein
VRITTAHGGQVARDLHPGTVRPGDHLPGVAEWHRRNVSLGRGPGVERRQCLHRQVPARRRQPHLRRTRQAMLGVGRQRVPQLSPITEDREPMGVEELHPRPEHLRVGPPRPRTRRAADRQLPQPPVDHRRRPGAVLVLEPQVFVDQHRHAGTDQRPVAQVPLVAAGWVEVVKQHERQPSRDHRQFGRETRVDAGSNAGQSNDQRFGETRRNSGTNVRVSTADQILDRQARALAGACGYSPRRGPAAPLNDPSSRPLSTTCAPATPWSLSASTGSPAPWPT